MCSNVFAKILPFLDNVGKKCCRAGQATDKASVHWVLDACGYKCTYSGCVMRVPPALQQRLHEHALALRCLLVVILKPVWCSFAAFVMNKRGSDESVNSSI
jgi:hypothetical protein